MKLTTRCGTAAVDGCNEALLAKAAEAKLLRTSRLRADTTVVPADVAYPTDSGLLAKAVRRIAATGRRIQAAGGATRTRVRDRSRSAGARAREIGGEAAAARGAGPRRGPSSGSAGHRGAGRARRARRRRRGEAAGQRPPSAAPRPAPGRAVAAAGAGSGRGAAPGSAAPRGRRPDRAARRDPADRRADPPTAVRHDPGRGDPAGQPARRRRPPDRQGPARSAGRVRLQGPGRRQRRRHRARPHRASAATPPTRRSSPPPSSRVIARTGRRPRTVTADRGYGEAARRERPARARRAHRGDPPQGQTRQGPPSPRTPPGVPPNREVAHRQRSPDQHPQTRYGWDRTRLDHLEGARIWTGHGVLAHNLVKIAALLLGERLGPAGLAAGVVLGLAMLLTARSTAADRNPAEPVRTR